MNDGQCTFLKSDHAHPLIVQLYDTSLPASSLTEVDTVPIAVPCEGCLGHFCTTVRVELLCDFHPTAIRRSES